MNRLANLLKDNRKVVLGVYFTAGYPQAYGVVDITNSLAEAGVDFVEVGMPFSDPLADGPVIQESSGVALQGGMTIAKLFSELKSLRSVTNVPVVLMGYFNPVLQFGFEKFLASCKECGVDGVILPDLPVEVYVQEYKYMFEEYGIYPVFLISPYTPANRIRFIARESRGFVYLVSSSSTTGSGSKLTLEQRAQIQSAIAEVRNLPVLVGFGIHDKESFDAATEFAAGGIVGSAFIRELKTDPGNAVKNLVKKIKPELYDYSVV